MSRTIRIDRELKNFDAARVPIKSSERVSGDVPYLGASGEVDRVEGFTHDGDYLCVSEDGENLRSRNTPIAWVQRGKFWANNHVHILGGLPLARLKFYEAALAVAPISSYITGSAQPKLSQAALSSVLVPRFCPADQVAVGQLLGALDDKIATNGALVSSAETLRRTAWVRATRGVEQAPLSSFAHFVNGGAYTKGATGTGRVVIRIAELNSGIGASTVYNDLKVPDRQVAHAGDLLMSWSGSLTAVRWYRDDAIINQHIFKVIPRNDYPLWAVASAVETKLDEFREIAAGKATTMGHIKRADLDSPVAWPKISDRLNHAGTALWERALAAERENLRLAATRDELLPLLMSGKITVKDAEKTVEEVV